MVGGADGERGLDNPRAGLLKTEALPGRGGAKNYRGTGRKRGQEKKTE